MPLFVHGARRPRRHRTAVPAAAGRGRKGVLGDHDGAAVVERGCPFVPLAVEDRFLDLALRLLIGRRPRAPPVPNRQGARLLIEGYELAWLG
jgi:hypothetical protein